MKILLIDPPGIEGLPVGRILGSFGINKADQAWPPYDLQIMAGYCIKNGYEAKIIDANNLNLSLNDIKHEIIKYNPQWVIYLTCFQTFEIDAAVAKIAKEVDPDIKTACMSLSIFSIESPEEKLRRHPYLDFIPWGEPEDVLMKLINGTNPDEIDGLYYTKKDGSISFTGGTAKVKNLDELGIPLHKGLPFDVYRCPLSRRKPMTIVNCSRGCINACVHCQAGNFQKPLRYRSVNSVLKELHQVKMLGIKEIKFYDCSLPTKRDFVEQLMNAMISERFNFTWNCNARADKLDEDILSLMKMAGCHTISIGCESGVPEILKAMRKNVTVEQMENAVRLVKKNGMRVLMYLTFGLEGETEDTMQQTFRMVKKLKPDYVTFGIVVPAPGTPFYNSLKEKGYLIQKELQWQDPTALPAYSYPHLKADRILDFSREAYRKYYFSPTYIMRRLLSLKSYNEFKSSVANAVTMLKRYIVGATK